MRVRAKKILNEDLIAQAETFAGLEAKLDEYSTYQAALDDGFVQEVRTQLTKTFRMGVKLEAFISSFTPPLASGGNVGVSADVQDGIYANVHGLTGACSEALHRNLALEKEVAVQKSKITDAPSWERYKLTLDSSMLHDVTKAILNIQSDLLNVANSVINNIQHLKPPREEKVEGLY